MAWRLRPTKLFPASRSAHKRDLGVETVTDGTRSVRLGCGKESYESGVTVRRAEKPADVEAVTG
jgi:hypothetical protein